MNNKLFFGILAASGMLLTTSCTKDDLNAAQSGNEAQVTFSLGLEGSLATRAISDGTGAKKLVYAVYKLDADEKPVLQKVVGSNENSQFVDDAAFDNGLTETVEITLAKGQTYQVAFWAQNPNCAAYTTTDLTQVGVSYDNAANNDENRDAFFKMVQFEVAGDKSIDVVMKRPFAQINVGVTAEDWEAAVASGIKIENSDVVIKNAATSINLLTGAISGEQNVTYTINAIPDEELMVDADGNGTKEAYHWLSMSYILVNDTHDVDEDKDGTIGDYRTNLESLAYTFTPASGNPIAFAEGLNNVPVQRNWRTNILGKILTGDIQFNITIDPVYDGDINVEDNWADGYSYDETTGTYHVYTTEGMIAVAALVDEVTSDKTVELTVDLPVSSGKTIHTQNATANITINGNGNSIVSTATSVDDFQWEGGTIPAMSTIFSSANGSKVTVNDLSFEGTMSALMLGHYKNSTYNNYNTELNNVNVIDTKVVSFSAGVSPAVCVYGTAVLNNCNIYGTTLSELDTDPMWPVYDVAAVNYSTTTVNGGKIGSFLFWNQAALIVNDKAFIEKLVILGNMNNNNANNYIKINSGAEVKEIDLSNITDKNRVKITIEDGATVGKIVANGVEYASITEYKGS